MKTFVQKFTYILYKWKPIQNYILAGKNIQKHFYTGGSKLQNHIGYLKKNISFPRV